jgi:hypothetical protein
MLVADDCRVAARCLYEVLAKANVWTELLKEGDFFGWRDYFGKPKMHRKQNSFLARR